jgi:DHA1 family bicyclomycin/chloramphenicol resistance-like MFS transporter
MLQCSVILDGVAQLCVAAHNNLIMAITTDSLKSVSTGRMARLRLLLVLSVLMAFGSISTDMYLPSLPSLAKVFHVGQAQVQLTLSLYLVGFGVGQLVWGPLGDRYGRKWVLVTGIMFHLAGSCACALAGSIDQMIGWRFVQALGSCAGPVLARAMVRDSYDRTRSAQMLSVLMLVMGVAPLAGPILGGEVLLVGSWRTIFWFQFGFGLLALGGMALIPETLPTHMRSSQRIWHALFNYAELLMNRRFLGYALIGACFYGGVFAQLAGTPFAYIEYYHVPAQLYGFLFALSITGMMAANLINSRLVVKLSSDLLLLVGTSIAAVAGTVLAIDGWTGFGGLWGIVLPVLSFVAMLGFITANAMAGALASFPHRAGTASALSGGMQFGFGAVFAAAVGWFADGTPWPMAWIMALAGGTALLAALLLVRR